jgi:hypothetical protein
MALADIVLDQRPIVGMIRLDASIRELHEEGAELSENPVESGANMTDHYRILPNRIQIEGVVSQLINPLGVRDFGDLSPTRHTDARARMLELRDSKERFTFVSSLDVYTNMMFESGPTTVRDLQNSRVWRFTAVLKRVEVAFTSLAEAVAAEAVDKAERAVARGVQGAIAAGAGAALIALQIVLSDISRDASG